MSNGIQFEEDNFKFDSSKSNTVSTGTSVGYGHPQYQKSEEKGMIGWLIRHGLASSGGSAQGILLGVVVINIVVTILIIMFLL